jgi:hypothetical protein
VEVTVKAEEDEKDEEVTDEKSGSGTERGKEGKEKEVADK